MVIKISSCRWSRQGFLTILAKILNRFHITEKSRDTKKRQHAYLSIFDFTENFLTFQNVKTYSPQLVDVGVIYFGDEADFRRCHGILLWEKEFKSKYSPFERRVLWSVYDYVKVTAIAFVRLCLDAWNVLSNQTPSFLGRKKNPTFKILIYCWYDHFRCLHIYYSANKSQLVSAIQH